MTNRILTVRLEIPSALDMLELVQTVTDQIGRAAGFEGDTLHWIGMSVRECVINAIVHGNSRDSRKRVYLDFTSAPNSDGTEFAVCVRDEGAGFDPAALTDPLLPENILRPSGRGIFLMRTLMDEVSLQRAPQGGMQVRMVKCSPRS